MIHEPDAVVLTLDINDEGEEEVQSQESREEEAVEDMKEQDQTPKTPCTEKVDPANLYHEGNFPPTLTGKYADDEEVTFEPDERTPEPDVEEQNEEVMQVAVNNAGNSRSPNTSTTVGTRTRQRPSLMGLDLESIPSPPKTRRGSFYSSFK